MDILHNLAFGFEHALTLQNLMFCAIGCVVGTLVGLLPGLGPLATTLLSAEKGNPIAIQYPTDGALLCIGPSAVMERAPHPNAARLFQNWLLSKEFAQVCADAYVTPVRDDVTLKPGAKPLAEVKTSDAVVTVLVPPGADGKCWSLSPHSHGHLWFFNAPNVLAASPEALLLPSEVVRRDGLGGR